MIILSVMHTGNRFSQNLFHVPFRHVFTPDIETILDAEDRIIVPLRHPDALWTSFRNRGRGEAFYREQWAEMERLWLIYRPKIRRFPIDTADRTTRLRSISRDVGRNIRTQWEPVAQQPAGSAARRIADAVANNRHNPVTVDNTDILALSVLAGIY